MELFDKRFVHFMWDDELEGKRCFVADYIDTIQALVEKGDENTLYLVDCSNDERKPFRRRNMTATRQFAYYDPNYEVKKAFNEGKKIQVYDTIADDWVDLDEPLWCMSDKYRVKPEEEKLIVYLARQGDEHCYLTACAEDNWEDVQKNRNVKTKLFVGTEDEVVEWYKSRQKFAETIKACEDGKMIQIRHTPNSD